MKSGSKQRPICYMVLIPFKRSRCLICPRHWGSSLVDLMADYYQNTADRLREGALIPKQTKLDSGKIITYSALSHVSRQRLKSLYKPHRVSGRDLFEYLNAMLMRYEYAGNPLCSPILRQAKKHPFVH